MSLDPTKTYLEWNGTNFPNSTNAQFKAPAGSSIDWGDGTVETFDAASTSINTHTYTDGIDNHIITISGLTSISSSAFFSCKELMSIRIGNSVTSINYAAFRSCSNLTSVSIGNSVTSIGSDAFETCSSLMSVTIGNSVTSIGSRAFGSCRSLTSITIPASVTSISSSAFYGCSSLQSITIDESNASYKSIEGNLYSLDGKTLIQYAIGKPEQLFEIPDNVEIIGENAFENCSKLTNVTIPNSITSIGSKAFYSCSNLLKVIIPDNVISVGGCIFGKCLNLIEVKLSNQITSLPDSSRISGLIGTEEGFFERCIRLTNVTIPNSITSIGSKAFYECYNLIEVKNLSSLIITAGSKGNGYVGYYAKRVYTEGESYLSTDENGNVIYDDGTDRILVSYPGTETDLTLPSDITQINQYAFYRCRNLKSITIPDSVTSIGNYAFEYCGSLTSITIGNGVTSIGNYAFAYCSSLKSVAIGNGVTSINNRAFSACNNLKTITLFPETPPTLGSSAIPSTTTIYVSQSSKRAYKAATNWTTLADKIESNNTYLSFVQFNIKNKEYIEEKVNILKEYVDESINKSIITVLNTEV